MRLSRRAFAVGAAIATCTTPLRAEAPGLDVLAARELFVRGRRVVVFTPKDRDPAEKLPFAVLLHGLGETGDPRMGAWAWAERYGLLSAHKRLVTPPVVRTQARGDLTDENLRDVNALLGAKPLRKMAFVCPHMPNLQTAPEARAYGDFLEGALLPAVRAEAALSEDPSRVALCGCSLGAFVGLEVFLKSPGPWGAFAGVQTAVFGTSADGFAERLARTLEAGTKDLFFSTSTLDHYRASTEALVQGLARRGVLYTYRLSPGPHDQPWLNEVGSLELLLWLDRRAGMYGGPPARPRGALP